MPSRLTAASLMLAPLLIGAGVALTATPSHQAPPSAQGGNALTLPPGFHATVFADNLGHVRHIAVTPDGTLYANTWSCLLYTSPSPRDPERSPKAS